MANFIWINGEFIHWNNANIHVISHSLHYSGAVFEGLRAYDGKIFKLEEHINRLLKSAEYMGLDVNYSARDINNATKELITKNNLTYAYIRPLIWRGSESIGLYSPNLTVNILVAAIYSKNIFLNNIRLSLSPWRKPNPNSFPCQAKSSAHYAMGINAQLIAKNKGYDDSLVLDQEGFVAECNVANIFFGKGNKLVTPIADKFLNGITRQVVIEIAKNIGFEVFEERISLNNLTNYDYSFMTGTSKEIGGIIEIDLLYRKLFFNDPLKKISLLQSEFTKLVKK